MSEAIKVILKQKSINILVDFCLEEKIEFSVRPQPFPDTDWEFNLMVKDIKTAVTTGMFLRENRIEVAGNEQQQQQQKAVKKPAARKTRDEEEKSVPAANAEEAKSETEEKGLFQ